jgi:hypothetical protein
LVDQVSKLPQADSAALGPKLWTWGHGKQHDNSANVWRPTDSPRDGYVTIGGFVSGDLLQTIGLRVIQGRGFTTEDRLTQPGMAVVNQTFAARLFNGAAIGENVRVANRGEDYSSSVDVNIVGIIETAIDPQYTTREGEAAPTIYVLSSRAQASGWM